MGKKSKVKALDEFYTHEALDRLHIVCSMIDDHLIGHEYIESRPEVKEMIMQASKLLADAYCAVGADHLD